MKTGTIEGFDGSWGSGIATLFIKEDGEKKARPVFGDNGPMVRALASMFEGVIGGDHTVNVEALKGQRVMFETDDLGLLSALAPECEEEG